MGSTPVGRAGSVDVQASAHRCSRGRKEPARTTVRRPGSLRGAATVMVGTAVASGTSAPSPVYAPRSDRVRPLIPDGGPGSSSLREQGRALLRSGAELSWSPLHDGFGDGIAAGIGQCPVRIAEEWHQQLRQRLDGLAFLIGGEVDKGGRAQVDVRGVCRRGRSRQRRRSRVFGPGSLLRSRSARSIRSRSSTSRPSWACATSGSRPGHPTTMPSASGSTRPSSRSAGVPPSTGVTSPRSASSRPKPTPGS